MIAAFLKNADGDFDVPALAASLPMLLIALVVLVWMIPMSIRKRRVLVKFSYTGMGPAHIIERDKNPCKFWFFIAFYIFGALFFLTIGFVFSMGLMRNHH